MTAREWFSDGGKIKLAAMNHYFSSEKSDFSSKKSLH